MSSPHDLEVIPPEGEDADRPHPLGPRDIIEVLSAWSRIIVTAVIVIAVGVGGFVLGRATNPTINQSPSATTGVLWSCGGRATGVVRGTGRVDISASTAWSSEGAGDRTLVEVEGSLPGERISVHVAGQELSVPVLSCQE